mmetsp:Transcript_12208/g.26254  ORF Transcript_12208/g.26254 Transcript_12208/m.26254 type:complete len:90 (+) Transcript_12208:3455-3724(+)
MAVRMSVRGVLVHTVSCTRIIHARMGRKLLMTALLKHSTCVVTYTSLGEQYSAGHGGADCGVPYASCQQLTSYKFIRLQPRLIADDSDK